MPIDWASRRAGSMVSTTTLRPRSAARRASAADVVVLPTPPEPQHTMMLVAAVVEQRVDVEQRPVVGLAGQGADAFGAAGAMRGAGRGAHAIPCSMRSAASS